MRYLYIIVLVLLNSCDEGNKNGVFVALNGSNILGVWQLEATKISPGGHVDWSDFSDHVEYTFNSDGTFFYEYAENPEQNKSGSYNFSDEKLLLSYLSEDQQISVSFHMQITNGKLLLQNIRCIEECRERYVRK